MSITELNCCWLGMREKMNEEEEEEEQGMVINTSLYLSFFLLSQK